LRKPTTLIAGKFGSRHFGTKRYVADAVRLTGRDEPVALYIGAASGDDRHFGSALSTLLKGAGIRKVVWPKLSKGKKKDVSAAKTALHETDLVFVGGGDVEAGIHALHDADLVEDLHGAAKRGVVFAGMSAGAIMLGERWIRWPREGAGDDEAETFECLGVAPCALDTHGEGDGWRETQSFAAVRARELGKKARAYGVPSGAALVIGTTGLEDRQLAAMEKAAHEIPIVYSRNLSVGVSVFMELVARAAKALGDGYDVEIAESHHRHKVDAPSGTALALGERVAAARGRRLEDLAVYARQGRVGPRVPGTIGFSVFRGGNIVGEHTVRFIGAEEELSFTHEAQDRKMFARGALRAARWVAGRAPGLYSMADVLGLARS